MDQASGLGWLGRRARAFAAQLADSRIDPPLTLSPAEIEDLVAFAEVLVEGRALPVPQRQNLLDHVQGQLQTADYYVRLYRRTVGLLNRLAGARMSSLDVPSRIALLTRQRQLTAETPSSPSRGDDADAHRDVRTRVVPDLIAGYYRSPAGWAVVDYATYPGVCGDVTRYTRSEQ